MPRALLAWEAGGGIGHAVRMAQIGAFLKDGGWDLDYAAREPDLVRSLIPNAAAKIHAGPSFEVVEVGPAPRLYSLPDHLFRFGYGDAGAIGRAIGHWHSLLAETRPDLVIADFAPTLTLAAKGRLPLLQASNGYLLPPPGSTSLAPDLLDDSTGRLLDAAGRACRALKFEPPGSFPDFFDGDVQAVTIISLFDPFAALRAEPPLGPVEALPRPGPAETTGLFCYFDAMHPAAASVLEALEASGLAVEIYLRNAPPEWLQWMDERPGFIAHRKPAPLEEALARNAFVLSYGSLGFTAAALSAGRPQLIVPMPWSREQAGNAQRVSELGLALVLRADASAADILAMLDILVHEPARPVEALAVALAMEAETGRTCLPDIAEIATRLAGG